MMAEMIIDKKTAVTSHKKLLFVTLAAAVLTLSACGKKETPVTEGEPAVDAQASVEQQGTAEAAAVHDDIAVASANEGVATTDMPNGDAGVSAVNDSEVMDGSKTEEHVSTY